MSHYICELNEKVERVHVRYQNRYGLMMAGDLYTAVDLRWLLHRSIQGSKQRL